MTENIEGVFDAANVADASVIEGGANDNASAIAGLRAFDRSRQQSPRYYRRRPQ